MKHEFPRPAYEVLVHYPSQQLFVIAPLLLLYHIGTMVYASSLKVPYQLEQLFTSWHAPSAFLPSLLIVVYLLTHHFLRRDRFVFSPGIQVGMVCESLVLWLPLLMMSWGSSHLFSATLQPDAAQFGPRLVESIGAGVFEEFVFRVVLLALLSVVLIDLLRMHKNYAKVIAVAISAITFALLHFSASQLCGDLPLDKAKLVFFVMAGAWFGAVYLMRGYAVAVLTHMLWDIVSALSNIASQSN